MKKSSTNRGFGIYNFEDYYKHPCSLQKSSLATADAIWLGVNDSNPQIMASQANLFGIQTSKKTGWVTYPIPEEVLLCTRMHLSRQQVEGLLPLLQHFVDTGELP